MTHGPSVKVLPYMGYQLSAYHTLVFWLNSYLTRVDALARFASVLVSCDAVATFDVLEALQTWALGSTCCHAFLRGPEIIFVPAATSVVKLLTLARPFIVEPA